MVLAAVDDLFFRSKSAPPRSIAGIELTFARTTDEMVAQAKALQPTLVIFDLNSEKTDPIATIAALKADAGLASCATTRLRLARPHRLIARRAERRGRRGPAALRVCRTAGRHPPGGATPAPCDHRRRHPAAARRASRAACCGRRCAGRDWLSASSERDVFLKLECSSPPLVQDPGAFNAALARRRRSAAAGATEARDRVRRQSRPRARARRARARTCR